MDIDEMRDKTLAGNVELLRIRINRAINNGLYQASVNTRTASLTSDEINVAREMLRQNYRGCTLQVRNGDSGLVFVVDWSRQ